MSIYPLPLPPRTALPMISISHQTAHMFLPLILYRCIASPEVRGAREGSHLAACALQVWTCMMTCLYQYSITHGIFMAPKLSVPLLFRPP